MELLMGSEAVEKIVFEIKKEDEERKLEKIINKEKRKKYNRSAAQKNRDNKKRKIDEMESVVQDLTKKHAI